MEQRCDYDDHKQGDKLDNGSGGSHLPKRVAYSMQPKNVASFEYRYQLSGSIITELSEPNVLEPSKYPYKSRVCTLASIML